MAILLCTKYGFAKGLTLRTLEVLDQITVFVEKISGFLTVLILMRLP